MIRTALKGQPAQGVGFDIQKKREKMKAIYKQGWRKLGSRGANTRQSSALGVKMPPNVNKRMPTVVCESILKRHEAQQSELSQEF